jgi:hypothetical protein
VLNVKTNTEWLFFKNREAGQALKEQIQSMGIVN